MGDRCCNSRTIRNGLNLVKKGRRRVWSSSARLSFRFSKKYKKEKNCQKYLAVKGLGKGRGRFATAIHLQPKEGRKDRGHIFAAKNPHPDREESNKRNTRGL